MKVNVNGALYGRCYAVARRFMLAAFVCCFFYGSSWGRDSIPVVNTDANEDGAVDSPVKPLSVGDEVPDVVLNMINYAKPVAKLSDFRGKVVILDFWATWCGGCIAAMPKEDTLQEVFGNSIQFLLVNSRRSDKISSLNNFLKTRREKSLYNISLPIVAEDSLLTAYFPHMVIPHYVIIDARGVVVAITSSNEINFNNIKDLLNGTSVTIHEKNDEAFYDMSKSYLLNGEATKGILLVDYAIKSNDHYEEKNRIPFTVFSKELYIDVVSQMTHFASPGRLDGVRFTNLGLMFFFQYAYPDAKSIPRSRWLIPESIKHLFRDSVGVPKFCFELVAPGGVPDCIIADWMRVDIFKSFGMVGEIISKDTDCYVIEKLPLNKRENVGNVPSIEKVLMGDYLSLFQDSWQVPVKVSKEDYLLNSILVPKELDTTLEGVKRVLLSNGYTMVKRREMNKFFVITKEIY